MSQIVQAFSAGKTAGEDAFDSLVSYQGDAIMLSCISGRDTDSTRTGIPIYFLLLQIALLSQSVLRQRLLLTPQLDPSSTLTYNRNLLPRIAFNEKALVEDR